MIAIKLNRPDFVTALLNYGASTQHSISSKKIPQLVKDLAFKPDLISPIIDGKKINL